jgi:hypothetical protein
MVEMASARRRRPTAAARVTASILGHVECEGAIGSDRSITPELLPN